MSRAFSVPPITNLQRDGLVPCAAIAICAAASIEFAVVFLGALRAGVAVAPLAPGITEVLHLNEETHKYPGLLGTAISGAGSTMIAFATDNCDAIANAMAERLASKNVKSRVMEVKVDNRGRVMRHCD